MSKVKANLVKVNMAKGNTTLATFIALTANIENGSLVYLPNAFEMLSTYGMTGAQFAGCLSALALEGKYKPAGKDFGEII